ncbi:peroxin-26-like protein [Ascosphaera apis ARSEF 7405]|uniref:Peroxin-26-like protein n=1 Tax=Ascosphaera apis ARSEF 7405 TaxID=392613 RepID=A0A162IP66_9EURO|nr:peroxin-26-like protein [Ascosphaera apis ARSEF 7405]
MASPQKMQARPQQAPPSPRGTAKRMQRIYKEALELFVTRRLPASLEAINSLVLPPSLQSQQQRQETTANGGIHGNGGLPMNAAAVSAAPVNLRVKIWNLYITLLSAIVDLGTEEGSNEFGEDQWRAMASSVRNGRIWEYVVRAGYQGKEGNVDGDIVFNLATLLLKHSNSQALNQQRLETYLASASQPSYENGSNGANGTETLRDLDTRIRILELFTLHVLPRNNDWGYAREFIKLSDILDDEKKEQLH